MLRNRGIFSSSENFQILIWESFLSKNKWLFFLPTNPPPPPPHLTWASILGSNEWFYKVNYEEQKCLSWLYLFACQFSWQKILSSWPWENLTGLDCLWKFGKTTELSWGFVLGPHMILSSEDTGINS